MDEEYRCASQWMDLFQVTIQTYKYLWVKTQDATILFEDRKLSLEIESLNIMIRHRMAKKLFKLRLPPLNSLSPESTEAFNHKALRNSSKRKREELIEGSRDHYLMAQKALKSCTEDFNAKALRFSSKRNRGGLNLSAERIKDLADKNGDMKGILERISEELSFEPSSLLDKYTLFSDEIAYKRTTGEEIRKNKEMKSTIEVVKALLSSYGGPGHRMKLGESVESQREVMELAMNANSISNTLLPKLMASEPEEISEQGTSSKRLRVG